MEKKWLITNHPAIVFEDNTVGNLKKEIWEASEAEIGAILKEYDIPSASELGKAGCYIQNTPRATCIEKRRKNDLVFLPVGCTENHGLHANSGLDTFMVTQILEGVRRYTAKQGRECSLAFPPLNYGGHPYHHMGTPGTVIMPKEVVEETLIYTMLGLWNDGYRKIIMVNNHGHLWMLESALQEFMKRFQLPGIFQVLDWHRAVREFFIPVDREDSLETTFIHADESETAVALLLLAGVTVAQEEYEVDWWTVDGGGYAFSTGDGYVLGGSGAIVTAMANDHGYDDALARQVASLRMARARRRCVAVPAVRSVTTAVARPRMHARPDGARSRGPEPQAPFRNPARAR